MKLFEKLGVWQTVMVIAAVAVLVLLSVKDAIHTQKDNKADEKTDVIQINRGSDEEYVKTLEEKLKAVLAKVEGVGNVEVMITLQSSSEKVALKDVPVSSEITDEENTGGLRRRQTNSSSEESTIYEESGNDKTPYVVKEIQPKIMGVVVVSQGGDNYTVKKEIIEAVQVLFGLETHMIKVMKQL